MLKHYVRFFFPGLLINEVMDQEISERNPEIVHVPDGAYGYCFYDRSEMVVNGQILYGKRENFSGTVYLGTSYTIDEIRTFHPAFKTLIKNLEEKGCRRAVKTRTGNWIPMFPGDIAI